MIAILIQIENSTELQSSLKGKTRLDEYLLRKSKNSEIINIVSSRIY